jgi:hypothetical protein
LRLPWTISSSPNEAIDEGPSEYPGNQAATEHAQLVVPVTSRSAKGAGSEEPVLTGYPDPMEKLAQHDNGRVLGQATGDCFGDKDGDGTPP